MRKKTNIGIISIVNTCKNRLSRSLDNIAMGLYFNKVTKRYYLRLNRLLNSSKRVIREVRVRERVIDKITSVTSSRYSLDGIRKRVLSIKYILYSIFRNKIIRNSVKYWVLPLVFVATLFIYIKPSLAQLSDHDTRLLQSLINGNLEVSIESVEGFSHGFYVFEGNKIYITEGNINDKQIITNGEYITWVKELSGGSQVFLYNIPTKITTQLTYSGTNINPKVNKKGNVVWEGWVPSIGSGQAPSVDSASSPQMDSASSPQMDSTSFGEASWQIFVYDGKIIRQVTQGDLATHADIEGDFIVYARKNSAGLWRSEAYSIVENKTADISVGYETEYPKLVNGEILLGPPIESQMKFPLKVSDLFLLNLPPLDNNINIDTNLSIKDILNELKPDETLGSATESAEINITITPTPESEINIATESGSNP